MDLLYIGEQYAWYIYIELLPNSESALFTFDLYDDDHSGVLQSSEVQEMLQDIYGNKFQQNKHARK